MKRINALRPAVLLLCAAGALSSFSALAFQQQADGRLGAVLVRMGRMREWA